MKLQLGIALLMLSLLCTFTAATEDDSKETKLVLPGIYWALDTIPDDTIRLGLVRFFEKLDDYTPPVSHQNVSEEDIDKIVDLDTASSRARCDYNRLVRFDARKAWLLREHLIISYERLFTNLEWEWALKYAEDRSDIDHRALLAHGSISERYLRLAPRTIPKDVVTQLQNFLKLASEILDEFPNEEPFEYRKYYEGLKDNVGKLFENYYEVGDGNYKRK